jgi:hypothetical protein
MPDRHKRPPISLRLPEALSAWLDERAAATGRTRHSQIIAILHAAHSTDRVRVMAAAAGLTPASQLPIIGEISYLCERCCGGRDHCDGGDPECACTCGLPEDWAD